LGAGLTIGALVIEEDLTSSTFDYSTISSRCFKLESFSIVPFDCMKLFTEPLVVPVFFGSTFLMLADFYI
jgi:hypothetical protein